MRLVDWFRQLGDRIGLALVLAIATLTRLWSINSPSKLVFDETYYVKDSYTLWKFGHEMSWPAGADDSFTSGNLDVYQNTPEFVVHGPLGKWIIGLGMQIFGSDNPYGWRFMPAIFGILAVWLMYRISLHLFGSHRWSLVPAFLLAIDGQAIVMSRTAILDGLLTTVLLLGFLILLNALSSPKPGRLLLLMGLVLGAGAAIKWTSGIFLAVFLIYYTIHDSMRWASLRVRATKTLVAIPAAIAAYLLSWTGWFVTQGWGYRANDVIGSFIDFHKQMYHFHSTLQMVHPYQANPLTWLAMIRPTSFFFERNGDMVSAISPIGNPVIWLAGIVALGFTFAWFAQNRDRVSILITTGYIAGYVPWLIYLNRTAFQFYSVTFEPWMMLMIVLMAFRYNTRKLAVYGGVAAFAVFLYFLPLYLGTSIPIQFWSAHLWLPTWL